MDLQHGSLPGSDKEARKPYIKESVPNAQYAASISQVKLWISP